MSCAVCGRPCDHPQHLATVLPRRPVIASLRGSAAPIWLICLNLQRLPPALRPGGRLGHKNGGTGFYFIFISAFCINDTSGLNQSSLLFVLN